MSATITTLGAVIIDQLFPKECLACQPEGEWLCGLCYQDCSAIQTPTCPFCDRLSPTGKTCRRCRRQFKLTGARSLWYYRGPVVDFIAGFKYCHVGAAQTFVAAPLAQLADQLLITQPTIITAVPLTPRRLASRGYNQSELLAQAISRICKIPYRRLLERKDGTVSQTRLGRTQRLRNVADQFRAGRGAAELTGQQIIVVDDVLTTGATLGACAAKLREAGASTVWGITLARD